MKLNKCTNVRSRYSSQEFVSKHIRQDCISQQQTVFHSFLKEQVVLPKFREVSDKEFNFLNVI